MVDCHLGPSRERGVKASCILHFDQIFWQNKNQIFGKVFDQGFWHPNNASLQFYWDGEMQFHSAILILTVEFGHPKNTVLYSFTILLGRRNIVFKILRLNFDTREFDSREVVLAF